MRNRSIASGGVACLLVCCAATAAFAQRGADRKLTFLDAATAGRDFQVQGEYYGEVFGGEMFGLQVVALGSGRFAATAYVGGFPGNGWDGSPAESLVGQWQDDLVVLNGPEYQVVIRYPLAELGGYRGQTIGYLQKVRRFSPTLGAVPPPGALVIFDETSLDALVNAQRSDAGDLIAGAMTEFPVRDFQMHLEFRTPFMPNADDQARGNSGIYIQRRYEVQILDSFGHPPVPNGCGALYRQRAADLNMSFPPLSWQTYDIYFTAARWDGDGNKRSPARITVLHNGIPIHQHRAIANKTGAGQPEGPQPLPILFQFHGDQVHYRNIWIRMNQGSEAVARARQGGRQARSLATK